ncbi:hypothetical protein [Motiliproteus sp.]|uniref:hypothetical protein n=1 Tax=Motiliproteus sp. TaxID=1898955 RepID=UPI003BA8CB3A
METQSLSDNYQQLAAERSAECGSRAAYFDQRLRFFSKSNWITVLVPSLLGVIAGSALLADTDPLWIGLGALVAGLLTAIHKGLDCDAHQAECRRLVQQYRGLETRYRTLAQIESTDIAEELLKLDVTLAELRQSQTATIDPQWLKSNADG